MNRTPLFTAFWRQIRPSQAKQHDERESKMTGDEYQKPLFLEMPNRSNSERNAVASRNTHSPISMRSLQVENTFAGHLEGSPESISKRIHRDLKERLSKELPWNTSLVILPCNEIPLPIYRFLMRLDSRRGAKTNDPNYASSLTVCWFKHTLDRSIQELLNWVIQQVDWETQAKDYNIIP